MSTPATLRRVVQLSITLVIGALCLWFAFRGVRDGTTGQEVNADVIFGLIGAVPLSAFLWYAAIFIVQVVVRVERWRLQVRGLTGRAPGWRDALTINAFAFAAIFFLPFRLGEFVRPNLCARRGIMTAPAGLAATALERIIDGLVTVNLFGLLLLAAPFDLPSWVRAGGLTALLFFGTAIAFLIVAVFARARVMPLVERILALISPALAVRLIGLIDGFLDGLQCFRGPKDIVAYVVLSVGYWILNGLGTGVLVMAIDPSASVFAGLFCLCFLVIGVMIPAPPGNVGTFHAFAKMGLMVTGVAAVPAVASAVLLHIANTLSLVVLAAVFVVVGSIGWRDASHSLDDASAPG